MRVRWTVLCCAVSALSVSLVLCLLCVGSLRSHSAEGQSRPTPTCTRSVDDTGLVAGEVEEL